MKLTSQKAKSLLALAGLFIASVSAQAATTYTANDLILGFRQNDPSNTNTLLVNIGSANNFRGTTITTGTIASLGTAISNWYQPVSGSTWFSDPNVTWGIVATIGSASQAVAGVNGVRDFANTLYGTVFESTYGTQSSTPLTAGSASQGGVRSSIVTMANAFNGQTQTAGINATIQPNGTTSSWNSYQSGAGFGGQGFSFFSGLEGQFANGTAGNNAPLDLYRFAGNAASGTNAEYLGTFSINNTGTLSFATTTPGAVPEPGRVAFMGLGLGAFLMRRRRAARATAA